MVNSLGHLYFPWYTFIRISGASSTYMTSQPIFNLSEAIPPFVFGIDVGGTGIKIGLLDDQGRTVAFRSIETDEAKGPADAMKRVAVACRELAQQVGLDYASVKSVGLGSPGSMDIPKGMLIEPPNLPHWHYFPIVECLEKEMNLPVVFANDANAAAFGEFWIGAGANHASMVMLTLGTGVGGGIIIDEHLVVGQNSFGGECGHMIVDSSPNGRLCVWGGGKGQLEAYSSASAVAARAKEGVQQGIKTILSAIDKPITSKIVYEEAKKGDPFCLEIIDEAAYYLGIAVTILVHTLDPGMVVLGGAMDFGGNQCDIGRRFLGRIQSTFRERSFEYVTSATSIDFASLGADAGYIGAAGLARSTYK